MTENRRAGSLFVDGLRFFWKSVQGSFIFPRGYECNFVARNGCVLWFSGRYSLKIKNITLIRYCLRVFCVGGM